ncbi:MAG: hypothetical protein J6W09_04005 [Bacteroidales bacterium]|nr:hypothetical protein [Bacteroidales bacterium]
MNKVLKIIAEILLAAAAVGLVYLIYESVMQPVNFNKEKAHREQVGIQRLKDIRTLQVAFKGVNSRFTADIDSLINFYNEGKMEIVMQIGSNDDSLAVANTAQIKRRNPRITSDQLMELYRQGQSLVFSTKISIPVRDTLFNGREDFHIDSLAFIPFSGGERIQMEAIVKTVSGVQVPLFEASMPYKLLLKGMDNQLRINLDAEREDQNKYPGLQVGSITAPNNNAGNWE